MTKITVAILEDLENPETAMLALDNGEGWLEPPMHVLENVTAEEVVEFLKAKEFKGIEHGAERDYIGRTASDEEVDEFERIGVLCGDWR